MVVAAINLPRLRDLRTCRPQVHDWTTRGYVGVDASGGARVVAVPDLDLILELATERHLGRLGLAPEAAEAVLEQHHDLASHRVDAAGQLKGPIDLKLHLAGKVSRERRLVDQPLGSVDEQNPRLVAAGSGPAAAATGCRVGGPHLGGADAVPQNAGGRQARGWIGDEAAVVGLVGGVEALGGGALEEDDLGGARRVTARRLGHVDVRGPHAARVADRAQKLRRGKRRRQAQDEERAALALGYVGRPVVG